MQRAAITVGVEAGSEPKWQTCSSPNVCKNSTGSICPCWQTAAWCLWDWWSRIHVSTLLCHLDTSVEGDTPGTGVRSCRHLRFSGEVVAGVTCKSLHPNVQSFRRRIQLRSVVDLSYPAAFVWRAMLGYFWAQKRSLCMSKMVLLNQCPAVLQSIMNCLCRVHAAEPVMLRRAAGISSRYGGRTRSDLVEKRIRLILCWWKCFQVICSAVIIVQNVLQLVLKQFRTQDPVLGTWPQRGSGRSCNWRRVRKSNVKFRNTTTTTELRLEICFQTFSHFPKHRRFTC